MTTVVKHTGPLAVAIAIGAYSLAGCQGFGLGSATLSPTPEYQPPLTFTPTHISPTSTTRPTPTKTPSSDPTATEVASYIPALPLRDFTELSACATPSEGSPRVNEWKPLSVRLGILYRYSDSTWKPYRDPLPTNSVAISPDGTAVVGTGSGSVVLMDAHGQITLYSGDSSASPIVERWITTTKILLRLERPTTNATYSVLDIGAPNQLESLSFRVTDPSWQRNPEYPLAQPNDWDFVVDPMLSRLAYVRMSNDSWPSLALVDLDMNKTLRQWFHPRAEAGEYRPSWSATGQYMAALLGPTTLEVTDASLSTTPVNAYRINREGEAQALTDIGASDVLPKIESISTSRTGRFVSFWLDHDLDGGYELIAIDTDSNLVRRYCVDSSGGQEAAIWSPDEKMLLFAVTRVSQGPDLMVADFEENSVYDIGPSSPELTLKRLVGWVN